MAPPTRNTPTAIPFHTPLGQQILARMRRYLSLPPTATLHTMDAALSSSPSLTSSFKSTIIKTPSPKSKHHEGPLTLRSTPEGIQGRARFLRDVQRLDIPDSELDGRPERVEFVRKVEDTEGLKERYAVLSRGELSLYGRQDRGKKYYRPRMMSPLRKEIVRCSDEEEQAQNQATAQFTPAQSAQSRPTGPTPTPRKAKQPSPSRHLYPRRNPPRNVQPIPRRP